jgi:hypothetical protein
VGSGDDVAEGLGVGDVCLLQEGPEVAVREDGLRHDAPAEVALLIFQQEFQAVEECGFDGVGFCGGFDVL